jgi:uncharacterized protein (UPF0303 family)
MSHKDDIARIAAQEATLVFPRFDLDTAWALGAGLRDAALARKAPLAIDISLRDRPLFHAALPGSTGENTDWLRRKRNTVLHFSKSSYGVGLSLAAKGETLEAKHGLPTRDYAAHGGGFPLLVKGLGCIGAVTVSGLPQRQDHVLVVEALALMLGKELDDLALG